MKNEVKWSAIGIGFLSGIGAFLVAIVCVILVVSVVAAGIGLDPPSHKRPGPLLVFLFWSCSVVASMSMGYVTGKLSRPAHLKNAGVLAFLLCIPSLIEMMLSFNLSDPARLFGTVFFIMFGAMFVDKR